MSKSPDPLDVVRRYLKGGHGLRDLARQTGVPPMTISNWLRRGTPKALVQGLLVIAAVTGRARR